MFTTLNIVSVNNPHVSQYGSDLGGLEHHAPEVEDSVGEWNSSISRKQMADQYQNTFADFPSVFHHGGIHPFSVPLICRDHPLFQRRYGVAGGFLRVTVMSLYAISTVNFKYDPLFPSSDSLLSLILRDIKIPIFITSRIVGSIPTSALCVNVNWILYRWYTVTSFNSAQHAS